MSNDDFYDREKERRDIPSKIRQNRHSSQIIILIGTTGVGKSALVENLLEKELREYKYAILNIGKNSPHTIDNLYYFNALYKKINETAEKQKEYALKTAAQHGRKNFYNWLRIIAGVIKNYFNFDPEQHIYEPFEAYSVSRKKEYILSALKGEDFIIAIENVQNIDAQSEELFQDILKNTDSITWILEYTLPRNGIDTAFYSFANGWKCLGIPLTVYQIQPLDFDLAFNLAPVEIQDLQRKEQLRNQYEKSQGNLLTIMVIPKNLENDADYIECKLKSLNQDLKYIIYILYLNESPIGESVLLSMLTKVSEQEQQIYFSPGKANRLLQVLIDEKIIIIQNEAYSIKHDSLRTALSRFQVNAPLFLAYRTLENYYRNRLNNVFMWEDREECINHLFSLYIRFHDEGLIELLPELREIIFSTKYPKEIIQKIERFRQEILKNGQTDINIIYSVAKFLTELCIKLQYPNEAQSNLDLIYNLSPNQYLIGLQGAIYALQSSQENQDKLDALIDKAQEGSRLRLSLCLCRLRMMMRSCNSENSRLYAELLLSCDTYQNTPEYGFLLYNYAEFAESPSAALKVYQEALLIFKKFGLVHIQGEIFLSKSMSYSYAGQLKKARGAIEKAKKLAPRHIPEATLLNNSAVIDILDNKIGTDVVNKLADAVLMSTNHYECLIIKSNWLTALILHRHMAHAAEVAEEIEAENYEVYQYEDFLHIIYQNLLFFYSTVGNSEKSVYYERKLLNLSNRKGINPGTKILIQLMLQKKQDSNIFYSQFPFRVDFLGFWGTEISRDLENFL